MKKLLAALIFFTRAPFWRIAEVPADCYRRVVDMWSFTGWLTGGVMAFVYWAAAPLVGNMTAAILALAARLLLTGALHEDGLADFFDGFGGGTDRERILAIMKDSHIGTYGVIALVVWFMAMVPAIARMPLAVGTAVLFASDPWSKFAASQIVNCLPYSRRQEEAKNRTVYSPMSPLAWTLSFVAGALPLLLLPLKLIVAAVAPLVVVALLVVMMRRKIGGYTGDCCGAAFLLGELAFVLTAAALLRI